MAGSSGAVRAAVCGAHGPPCDRTVQAEKLLTKRDGAAGRLVAPLTVMVLSATEPPMLDVTEPPVLDVFVMAAIRALGVPGEPDVYAEVARLFLTDVPIHLSALGAAIAAGRIDAVCQIAHRLRGSALEMGVLRMAPVCAAIEHGARSGSLEHAAEQADRLACEFASARRALEQVIQ
jgi:HPt (histidine-containing phosphotransfer) domain-containing protein